jgi:mono/diheme cytochrome c family protein
MRWILLSAWLISLTMTGCHDTPYVQGKRLYTIHCQNCHMEDGSGLGTLIPPIVTSKYLGSNTLTCLILNGKRDTIRQKNAWLEQVMPANRHLSNAELTNLINFIEHRWNVEFSEKTILQVETESSACQESQDN